MRFEGKVVIVSAGSTGIGKATAEEFLKEGASVVISNRNQEKGFKVEKEFKAAGYDCTFIKADISKENEVIVLIDKTIEQYGKIDILVNNAALFILRSIDATVEEWNKMLGVNIIGTAQCSKYAVEQMKKQGGGTIVNISSISGKIAQPNQLTYNVTKAGIIEMTKCMALDLQPYNIRVNCVSPGYVMTEQLRIDIALNGLTEEQAQKEWGGRHVLKRISEPVETARAVLFMASDDASFITGENLMVDGGYTII